MDGDNKYMAEGHGLQRAEKGIRFLVFPPVLFIHLKRFEFDYATEGMTKVSLMGGKRLKLTILCRSMISISIPQNWISLHSLARMLVGPHAPTNSSVC